MATATSVLARARKWIGHRERVNNRTRFNDLFYGRAVNGSAYPWCAAFTSVICQEEGMRRDIDYPHSAGVAVCFNWFRRQGRIVSKHKLKPGDMVRFTFSHIGFFVRYANAAKTAIVTIEGNTSAGNAGSQRDGGGVHQRVRSLGLIQYGGRPNYTGKVQLGGGTKAKKGIFGMTIYKPKTRKKDVKLKKGKWQTIPVNDKGDVSIVSGLSKGQDIIIDGRIALKGLPKGSEAQVRFYTVSYKKGTPTRRLSTHYAQEIVGTSGGTFGQVTHLRSNEHSAAKGRSIRVRAEICVYRAGVSITRAQFIPGKE